MSDSPLIRVVQPRILPYVICPHCGQKQPFLKKKEHWRTIKSLWGERWALHREELWERKWGLLKHIDRWTQKDHLLIPEIIEIYKGTPVEKILLFEEELWNIFELSKTKPEAMAKRNTLVKGHWGRDSWHLQKCIDFLSSPKFDLMLTYLKDPRVPRCGHSETLINIWGKWREFEEDSKPGKANSII